MKYSELQATAAYRDVPTGSGARIVIYRVSDGAPVLIGSTTGLSGADDFEQVAIEESGEDGVNEIATGRHTGSANCSLFFRPELNDKLPTRDTFLGDGRGEEYTILRVVGDKRIGVNIPLDVYEGCKITRFGIEQGARGPITAQLSFLYIRRRNGKQWMEDTGDIDYAA